jgi:pyridoxine/pyridoxamine 5'-phosphate oxidase
MNSPVFGKADVLAYMRKHRLAVVSTCAADGAPQGALVGIATTDSMELVFDTLSSSRKHANLSRDRRVAVTFTGPEEQTLQLEGVAVPVSTGGPDDAVYRDAYYLAWPDGRDRLLWAGLSYWRILPRWARYSDFSLGPLIAEFGWDAR